MLEIVLNNVSKSFGEKEVLKNINFEVKTEERVALIGSNGNGKSTILKLISKDEFPTTGKITIRKNVRIGFLPQEPFKSYNEKTVESIFREAFEEIDSLKKRLAEAEKKMIEANEEELERRITKYLKIQEEYNKCGGYEIEANISKLVTYFQIETLLDKEYKVLSGGEKTIVSFIRMMLNEPDILLLDEPTNHLDISLLELLEKYLKNSNKTMVIVSHDRYFLDNICNKTILIENGEEEVFCGNYSYYLKENEERIMREFNDYKTQQKKIEAMKQSIKRLKEYGKLAYPCGEKFFRRAASIEKRLEKIEVLDKPQKNQTINLKFNSEKRSGNDVLEFSNFSLSIANKELLKNTSCKIRYQERICLLGQNGTGKSTLIKEIINHNSNIKIGSNVSIGYIDQNLTFENEDLSTIEEARKYFIGYEEHLRSALIKFLFYSEGLYTKIKYLSGGEKLRLKMFCLMQQNSNFLILDEPTNHIDINTKEILEESLKEYNGTILIVSHDRYFINRIATRLLVIENKKINSYIGNYDDFKRQKSNIK